jgi:hypothetical protein
MMVACYVGRVPIAGVPPRRGQEGRVAVVARESHQMTPLRRRKEWTMKLIAVTTLVVSIGIAVAVFDNANRAHATGQVLHGYICRREVGGLYDDPLCTTGKDVLQIYNKVIIPAAAEKLTVEGAEKFELEGNVGTKVLISCSKVGKIANAWDPEPVETSPGEGEATLTFESCSVSEPAGCSIEGGKITTKTVRGVMEEREKLGPGVKIKPASGEVLAEIAVGEKCPAGKVLVVKGSTFGITDNPTSSLKFTNESGSLTMGTKAASLRGKSVLSVAEGTSWVVQAP